MEPVPLSSFSTKQQLKDLGKELWAPVLDEEFRCGRAYTSSNWWLDRAWTGTLQPQIVRNLSTGWAISWGSLIDSKSRCAHEYQLEDIPWTVLRRKTLVSHLLLEGLAFCLSILRVAGWAIWVNSEGPGTSENHSMHTYGWNTSSKLCKVQQSRSLQATSWGNTASQCVNLAWMKWFSWSQTEPELVRTKL